MESLAEQLTIAFKEDDSDANLRKWAKHISENNVDLNDVLELLHSDRYTTMRFLWLMGGIVEIDPKRVYPLLSYLFSVRDTMTVPNYERSLAKFFWLAGVPPEMEAEVIDELFRWLINGRTITMTKSYAASALQNLTRKYPDLKKELKLVLEDQLDKNGVSFRKRAAKILLEL